MRHSKGRWWRGALAGALVAGLWASPAIADSGPAPFASSQCGSGGFCVWSATSYTGTFAARTSDGTLPVSPAKSYWNRSSKAVRVYVSSSGSGSFTCIPAGQSQSSTMLTVGYLDFLLTASC